MVGAFALILLLSAPDAASEPPSEAQTTTPTKTSRRAGRLSLSWGYLATGYTNNDLHFEGDGYRFTLIDVEAHDSFGAKSFFDMFTGRVQYSARIGYYLDDNWVLSIGNEHLKYIVTEGQNVEIKGSISAERSEKHAGEYDGQTIRVGYPGDVLTYYDHTDGVNLFDFEVGYTQDLWGFFDDQVLLTITGGLSVGFVLPNSDTEVFDTDGPMVYELGGYGVGASADLRVELFRWAFLSFRTKTGFISFSNISTAFNGKSAHDVWYIAPIFSIGALLPVREWFSDL